LAVSRLASHLRRQHPAVLQTFLFHANIVGRLAARLAGVPHVVSGIRVAERRDNWHLAIDRWTSRFVDRHVCVSEDVARYAREVGRLPAERLVVIPNGVDIERFQSAKPVDLTALGVGVGRRAVTYVGRLDRQKRVDWLLALAPQLFARVADCDLVLVGEGTERAAVAEQARNLGISDRVHLVGWRDDVPAILKASTVVALPSAWEGMPNVVLEAMAAGRPVVATDVEGVRELLGPAGRQQIAPGDNPHLFVDKAVSILSDNRLAEELGRQNLDRAAGQFSLAAMVAAYEKLYRSLQET
jgi:glycosyltransferase involved in cell wall biosynthesis